MHSMTLLLFALFSIVVVCLDACKLLVSGKTF